MGGASGLAEHKVQVRYRSFRLTPVQLGLVDGALPIVEIGLLDDPKEKPR